MSKFKIGDKVRIRKDSQFYTMYEYNPRDVTGTIKKFIDETYSIRVAWDNGRSNAYGIEDLIHTRIKDTKIARKMNPKYKVLGNGWLEVV